MGEIKIAKRQYASDNNLKYLSGFNSIAANHKFLFFNDAAENIDIHNTTEVREVKKLSLENTACVAVSIDKNNTIQKKIIVLNDKNQNFLLIKDYCRANNNGNVLLLFENALLISSPKIIPTIKPNSYKLMTLKID